MPIYEAKAPDGRTLSIEGPTPPSEAELDEIFAAVAAPDFRAEVRASEGTIDERGPVRRFLSNAAQTLLPSTTPSDYIAGPLYALQHPVESAKLLGGAMVGAHRATGEKALERGRAAMGGDLLAIPEAIGYGAATALPLVGPAAAAAGAQMAAGDVAGGLGTTTGLLTPSTAVAARAKVGPLTATLRERIAASADRGSVNRLADVMAPKVGANKVRFGNRAADVAPRLAREEGLSAFSRSGLQSKVEAGLAQSEAALDAAATARNAKAVYHTKPIIRALRDQLQRQTAQTVRSGRVTAGKDVVPAPNRARAAQIQQAIKEIQALGPVASYESLRRVRQAYDAPAKATYSPSMTADFMMKQGEKLGAADVTGVLREKLAAFDPQTAAANAEYSLYKTASDVLAAAEEVQRTRPTVGRQIVARGAGGMTGGAIGGWGGAALGVLLGPIVDAALSSGVTTKIVIARRFAQLADALRANQPKRVNMIVGQLRQASVRAGRLQTASEGAPRVPQAAQNRREQQQPERQYAR